MIALVAALSLAAEVPPDALSERAPYVDGGRSPRGQIVDLEPTWTGAAAGAGAALGTAAGIGTLLVLTATIPPDAGISAQLLDSFGFLLPVAGAAFGAGTGAALFLALDDAAIVASGAASGALAAGSVVLLLGTVVALFGATDDDTRRLVFIAAGASSMIGAAVVAWPTAAVLDESAY